MSVAICSRVFPAFGYVHTQLIEAPRSELSPHRYRNMYKFWAWTDERGDNMKSSSTQTNITFPMPKPQDANRRKIFFTLLFLGFFAPYFLFNILKSKEPFMLTWFQTIERNVENLSAKYKEEFLCLLVRFSLFTFSICEKEKNVEAN